ncbi:predicted protein [Nematostella vectensis]|uniref:Fibrinogen C-terminal domain-containing protein n=1 Tax=Nematostella vectensis TaxID=45351 RepID=A7SBB0_NEMVE|nr:predicted protein [Nematostella vectensis]|eukprot:XP_001631064.1 predicted protein [Nematostella vectensis]
MSFKCTTQENVFGFMNSMTFKFFLPRCFSVNFQISATRQGKCDMFDRILSNQDLHQETVLEKKQGFVFAQMVAPVSKPRSCLEYGRAGVRVSGIYDIYDKDHTVYPAYCDFTSEPGSAWTLLMSEYTVLLNLFKKVPLYTNLPLLEDKASFSGYRLSLDRMKALRDASTHWRITCSFPQYGVDYRDYVRARFSDFDMIEFKGDKVCKKVEYMNIMGHNCTGCQAGWWQGDASQLHHDSSVDICQFGETPGAINSQDNFGLYNAYNDKFRCTSGSQSSTNHWAGGYL